MKQSVDMTMQNQIQGGANKSGFGKRPSLLEDHTKKTISNIF